MSKLIFGCGYLGVRIAQLWRDSGEIVYVVTRSADRAEGYQAAGYEAIVADVTQPDTLVDLPAAETVLFAVGFDRSVGNTIGEVYADGVKNVLATLPSSVERFIYISTTGVYGPAEGEWVNEETPPNPQRDGGKASLAAEQLLYNPPPFAKGGARGGLDDARYDDARDTAQPPHSKTAGGGIMQTIVLRLAGIYGPGRIPYLAKLRAGEPIAAPSEGWLNLINVDDGAAIVLAAEAHNRAQSKTSSAAVEQTGPNIYCVSDGQPVIRGDYYREVARRIGAEPPQFVTPNPSSPSAARAAADKRVSNSKLLNKLNYQFKYPSYQEGLAAILGEGERR